MFKFLTLILTSLFLPVLVQAQIEYKLTTPIPGLVGGSQTDLGSYIATLFQFGLAIVGLTAFGSIIFHGVKYIAGGANTSYVQDAKDGIWQAIYGVILLLAAVTILDTINPCIIQTVNFWQDDKDSTKDCESDSLPRPTFSQEERINNLINQSSDGIGEKNLNNGDKVFYFNSADGRTMEMIVYLNGIYEINSYIDNEVTLVVRNNQNNSVFSEPYDFLNNKKKTSIRQKIIDFINLPGLNEDQPISTP